MLKRQENGTKLCSCSRGTSSEICPEEAYYDGRSSSQNAVMSSDWGMRGREEREPPLNGKPNPEGGGRLR